MLTVFSILEITESVSQNIHFEMKGHYAKELRRIQQGCESSTPSQTSLHIRFLSLFLFKHSALILSLFSTAYMISHVYLNLMTGSHCFTMHFPSLLFLYSSHTFPINHDVIVIINGLSMCALDRNEILTNKVSKKEK